MYGIIIEKKFSHTIAPGKKSKSSIRKICCVAGQSVLSVNVPGIVGTNLPD